MASNDALTQIKDAFASMTTVPHCSGSVPLDRATSTIFYSSNGKAELIDFTKPTEAQLVALAETCHPATFGLDNQDVLDETYRKAGKMDTTEFATQFSPLTNGMVGTIKANLLQEKLAGAGAAIRVELYKLNVYGPGSFFKAHVDTPRGEDMFGSLVVVLPTVHEGGSLILRHGGKETIFDTAHAVSPHNTPHAAFVAFYSDVEHEVALVKSGYRVTLTYNLYFTNSIAETEASGPGIDATPAQRVGELQALLTNLFNDPKFLPEGGFLGFGLSHQYPFKRSSYKSLGQITANLKGGDHEVKRVCEALGLKVLLKAVYTTDDPVENYPCCLLDTFFNIGYDEQVEDGLLKYIYDASGSNNKPLVVYPNGMDIPYYERLLTKKGKPIVWLRPSTTKNAFKKAYLHYGNEASLSTAYGNVCLVAEVATVADRVAH